MLRGKREHLGRARLPLTTKQTEKPLDGASLKRSVCYAALRELQDGMSILFCFVVDFVFSANTADSQDHFIKGIGVFEQFSDLPSLEPLLNEVVIMF